MIHLDTSDVEKSEGDSTEGEGESPGTAVVSNTCEPTEHAAATTEVANLEEGSPRDTEEGDGPTELSELGDNRFWKLLAQAGYELW